MPRAIRLAAVALGLLALLPLQPRAAQQKVELVNGIGLIDYSQKPHFKVGDWVRYRTTAIPDSGQVGLAIRKTGRWSGGCRPPALLRCRRWHP